MTGAGIIPPAAGCSDAALDGDLDVDQADFARFRWCLSGVGVLADPTFAG